MKRFPLLLLVAGCAGPALPPPTDTGARDTAVRFYEAVIAKDWAAAHALLAPDPKRRLSADQFARLAADHRRSFGFEPRSVTLHACAERQSEAVAHVVVSGKGTGRHRFKDAIALRREADGWRVVLPTSFGHARR